MRRMRVCIITGPALAATHGTGAQILRLFNDGETDFHHLYWSSRPFGRSEYRRSYRLEDPQWRLRGAGRLVRAARRGLGLHWWSGTRVNARRLARLLAREGP